MEGGTDPTHLDACEERATKAETNLPDNAFLFSPTVDASRPWRPDGVSLAFIRARKTANGPKIPLHSLRHFAATRTLAAGVPVRTVAGRLGHADAATTLNLYGHWVEASDQAAASVLGGPLDGALDDGGNRHTQAGRTKEMQD